MKKTLIVLAAVVLAPVLVVSLVSGRRRLATRSARLKLATRFRSVPFACSRTISALALVRVEYKEPAELPQGGPFVEMRARVRFNCSSGTAAPTTVWFYSRDRSGRFVVSKKATHDDQFGKSAEGGFADLVSKNVCSQTK